MPRQRKRSAALPPNLRRLLAGRPEALDRAALEFGARILLARIAAVGDALEAVLAISTDPREILLESARARTLKDDLDCLRRIQETVATLDAARTTTPRDYRCRTDAVTIEDGPDGIKVLP
jgi:hypothetical protein